MTKKRGDHQEMETTISINKKTIYIFIIVSVIIVVGVGAYLTADYTPQSTEKSPPGEKSSISIIQSVSADEMGSMFLCPCCGNPITKGCCPMAKERMTYISAQIDAGLNRTQIIKNMVKKYGLTSMIEDERENFKADLSKNAPQDRPKIEVTPAKYNFGDVSVAAGVASTLMNVRNKGTKDLIIDKITTSCGCTSASIIVNGVEGPKFSMPGHGKQPTGWSATIAPGGDAQLKVYYDPRVHKDMRGRGTRTVDISSNDPVEITKQVRIEFNQIA